MIPHSPLSFIYHITIVSRYREEMHTDIRQALWRFDVDNAIRQRFGESGAEQRIQRFRRASFEIERAAYGNRAEPGKPLLVPMQDATDDLFSQTAPHLAWEIVNGRPGNDQAAPSLAGDASFLQCVYLLFYSSAFRSANELPPTERFSELSSSLQTSVSNAWSVVRQSLLVSSAVDNLDASLNTLMWLLSYEFQGKMWNACW
jgi:hypothetical protein